MTIMLPLIPAQLRSVVTVLMITVMARLMKAAAFVMLQQRLLTAPSVVTEDYQQ